MGRRVEIRAAELHSVRYRAPAATNRLSTFTYSTSSTLLYIATATRCRVRDWNEYTMTARIAGRKAFFAGLPDQIEQASSNCSRIRTPTTPRLM